MMVDFSHFSEKYQPGNNIMPATQKSQWVYWGMSIVKAMRCCKVLQQKCFNVFQIQIYSPNTHQVKKSFSKFKNKVYCGSFRNDGQLLIAGVENSSVQVCMKQMPLKFLFTQNCDWVETFFEILTCEKLRLVVAAVNLLCSSFLFYSFLMSTPGLF